MGTLMKILKQPNGIKGVVLFIIAIGLVAVVAYSQVPDTDKDRLAKINRMYVATLKEYPKVDEISADALASQDMKKTVIVDVRESAELKVSRIPGAITAKDFEATPGSYRDKTIVFYCTIGYRSGLYAEKLRARGWTVRNLKGGILAWAHAGKDLVDEEDKATKTVHVYGRKWNLLPKGYKGIW